MIETSVIKELTENALWCSETYLGHCQTSIKPFTKIVKCWAMRHFLKKSQFLIITIKESDNLETSLSKSVLEHSLKYFSCKSEFFSSD